MEIIVPDFKPKKPEEDGPGLTVKRVMYSEGCQHDHHSLDTVLRRVSCRDCGEVLDPFEVVLHWARHWEMLANDCKALHAERKQRRHELAVLKRAEKNARARIRRVGA